jgi:hypothetical protein
MRYGYRLNSMRSMNHATCYALILLVASFLLWSLGCFCHVLKVLEKVISESMRLCVPHGYLFFKGCPFTMHWTGSHQHLVFRFFHVELVAVVLSNQITRMSIGQSVVLLSLLVSDLFVRVLASATMA